MCITAVSRRIVNTYRYAPLFGLVSRRLVRVLLFLWIISCLVSVSWSANPPEPAREFRGTWVASVFNLDWPASAGSGAAGQRAQLIALLDNAKRLNLNAVILQVRPNSDALYRSSVEPWSAWLTGTMGADPGYDPLAFAVEEAHRRGLQLHAWVNPFRALATTKGGMSPKHISRRHPEWIRSYGSQLFIDPGIPEAQAYVKKVLLDIVQRYDIDGLHMDDYFYPYPVAGKEFPDGATFRRFGGGTPRSEWRRQNINRFMSGLYSAVKSEKPHVLVGISPFGIWRPGVPAGTTAGIDAYETLGCDARLWIQRGWLDYLSPQLYWPSEPAAQSFPALYGWWSAQNSSGRHLWPGIATERVGAKRPASEQVRQILTIRRGTGTAGHIHWNNKALLQNRGGVSTLLAANTYAEPALVPASPWLGRSAPARPRLSLKTGGVVDWGSPGKNIGAWLVQWQTTAGWQTQIVGSSQAGVAWRPGAKGVAVRAVSRTGFLSETGFLSN